MAFLLSRFWVAIKWRRIFPLKPSRIKKPAHSGFSLKPRQGALSTRWWMWRGWNNDTWCYDIALYWLHGHESAAAIYIGALVVTFFRVFAQIATGARMSCMLTLRAMKHTHLEIHKKWMNYTQPFMFCESLITLSWERNFYDTFKITLVTTLFFPASVFCHNGDRGRSPTFKKKHKDLATNGSIWTKK